MPDLNDRALAAVVPREFAGLRFDAAAAKLFDDYSRAVLTQWIKAGILRVDGQTARPKTSMIGGERLSIEASGPEGVGGFDPARSGSTREPQPVNFSIVFQDDDVVVIDKPAGLVVHPGAGNPDRTLANGLLHRWPQVARLPRSGLVHRLDKDTTGLMVVALSHRAHKSLTDQLKDRLVTRRYSAVVEGVLVSGREIEASIGRHHAQRTRQAVREDGRYALTTIRVQHRFRAHTLVTASLATGRTHQIRVHLSHIGFPLVGDRRYGARNRLPSAPSEGLIGSVQAFRRQALHAGELGFDHPGSGARIEFTSAIPPDLAQLVAELQADRDGSSTGLPTGLSPSGLSKAPPKVRPEE